MDLVIILGSNWLYLSAEVMSTLKNVTAARIATKIVSASASAGRRNGRDRGLIYEGHKTETGPGADRERACPVS